MSIHELDSELHQGLKSSASRLKAVDVKINPLDPMSSLSMNTHRMFIVKKS